MVYQRHPSELYAPTPSHILSALKSETARGFICTSCGYVAMMKHDIFGYTCPACFRAWAKRNLPQLQLVAHVLAEDRETALVEALPNPSADDIPTPIKIRKPTKTLRPTSTRKAYLGFWAHLWHFLK